MEYSTTEKEITGFLFTGVSMGWVPTRSPVSKEVIIVIYGLDSSNNKISAFPGAQAVCPVCLGQLVPKCGEINTWHWAHMAKDRCDSWIEPESEWHREWKSLVEPSLCEVVIGQHRADLIGRNGIIIKLQSSYISPEEIRAQESFFDNMIWLFDVRDCAANIDLRKTQKGYYTYRWKWPRKHIGFTSKNTFLDLGGYLFNLRKMHTESPVGGWGYKLTTQEFINRYIGSSKRLNRDNRNLPW